MATHPQLGTYQLAVEHGAFGSEGQTSAGAALLHLGKAAGTSGKPVIQQQPPLETQDDPAWAAELVAETAEGMGGARLRGDAGFVVHVLPGQDVVPGHARGEHAAMTGHSAVGLAAALGLPPPTDEQRAVIEADPLRPVLVVAGAGSGQDRDDGLARRLAGRQRPRRAGPGARPHLHPQGRHRAGRADRPPAAPAHQRRHLDAQARSTRTEPSRSAASPSCRPTTRMPVASFASTRCASGYEPESRLLSEAAAWQYAYEVVSRYDGDVEELTSAESTVTEAVVVAGRGDGRAPARARGRALLHRRVRRGDAGGAQGGDRRSGCTRWRPRRCCPRCATGARSCRWCAPTSTSSARRDAMDFGDQMALAARLAKTGSGHRR